MSDKGDYLITIKPFGEDAELCYYPSGKRVQSYFTPERIRLDLQAEGFYIVLMVDDVVIFAKEGSTLDLTALQAELFAHKLGGKGPKSLL